MILVTPDIPTQKAALNKTEQWYLLEQQITDLRTRANALRKAQDPYSRALFDWLTANITPANPLIELGNLKDGYRLYFQWQPKAISWKELAIARMSPKELTELTDTRPKEPKLVIEPRTPRM
jgi:hypothetical protein